MKLHLPATIVFALSTCAALAAQAADRPNLMLIIADDMTWRDCAPYGNDEVITPNLSRLAHQGMRFDYCFTATAMCAPTRQQIYTGLFPVRSGAYPNHSRVRDGVRSIVHHLRALDYRVGLIGKQHFGPRPSFPFEILAKGNKNAASDRSAIASFVNRDAEQPYCLIVASNEPHAPWSRGDRAQYDASKLTVPPYLVDTPQTRKSLVEYYAEISFLDEQVGACLDVVDASADPENTMVLFTSEQGSSFPFGGKWTCYDTGLRTALIVRWPARVKAGSSNSAMVQYVDFLPTLIDAAGGDPRSIDTGREGASGGGKGFDGKSFLPVLLEKADRHNAHVYGVHTTRGIINGSESYPVRSIRGRRYKLIRNLNSAEPFSNILTRDAGLLTAWSRASEQGRKRAHFYRHRPAEELYDLEEDPWELNNLAGRESLAKVHADLGKRLDRWMRQQGDAGLKTEAAAKQRQGRRGKKKE